MHLSRRNLLLASSAAAVFGRSAISRAASAPPKNFILVFANGGWDVTYCMDPKVSIEGVMEGPDLDPGSNATDSETITSFGDIPIRSNPVLRGNADDFFTTWGSRTHVVNGIWTGSIAHAPCRIRLFTGSSNQLSPDSATIFGYETASAEPLGTVDMSGLSFPGPLAASTGRIGFQSQIKALVDPADQWDTPLFRPAGHEQAGIDTYLAARAAALGDLRADGGVNDARIAGLLESRDRAARFKSEGGIEAMAGLELGRTPSFVEQAEMAADMLSRGLCRALVLGTGSDWDTHIINFSQNAFYENLFLGLGTLADALDQAQLLDSTLVVVMSEMTRTPIFNDSGGKDHWAHTSALMFGGPVRGNATSGETTDDFLESIPMNLATGVPDPAGELCKYDNLTAGILEMLGVDAEEWLPGVTPFLGAQA
ncbi:MAG: DUF1501 domain-containing protein [Deltaproteobacteria bacterium]|nr:DUF1501 domain-containing protein [Deltaproteobacteria bacterium]